MSTAVRGILAASPPAVCFQYSGNSDASKAELSAENPGFNLIDAKDRQVTVRTVRFAPPSAAADRERTPPAAERQKPEESSENEE
jgi:hypothetical protein